MKHLNLLFLSTILSSGLLWAQADESILSLSDDAFYSMSLEELMNIRIVSVSKKSERLFEAPLSSYIISKQDIINAGSTSIPEALKLCPGIIVRELANGIYDFHIRGFDNPTQYSLTTSSYNLLTLVMIDNRPVFNLNNGGTFFETLPIDINDIERIEVVRGPASALYGPNAVTGVINIITSRPEKGGVSVSGNAQYGSYNSLIANSSIGFKKNKFDITVSGNVQQRDRSTTTYYQFFEDKMVKDPADFMEMLPYGSSFYLPISENEVVHIPFESLASPLRGRGSNEKFPYPELALDKQGVNLYANYGLSSDFSFNLSAGFNISESQRPYYTHYNTLLSTNSSNSKYINFGAKIYEGNFRAAAVKGIEHISYVIPGMKYDFNLFDLNFDYDIAIGTKLSFRPSISMQEASYDDTEYTVKKETPGMLNGEKKFQNIAGAIRLDYKPIENLRLIAGFRTDKFNHPDDLYYSYQFSASYLVNTNFMLRSTYSKANSGSYIGNTYVNFSGVENLTQMGLPVIWRGEYNGNRDMKIFVSRMFEIGWRAKLTEFLQIDMDIFTQGGSNMMNFVVQPQQTSYDPQSGMFDITVSRKMENSDTRIRMNGATFSANVALHKIMIKPFITYQYSKLTGFNRYQIHPDVNPVNNVNQKIDKKHDTTPDYYGGMYFNYNPVKKLNINFSPYLYGKQQHYHEQDNVMGRETEIGKIPAKFQLNGRIGYKVIKGMDLFVSGKNILNQNTREFYGVDEIGAMYFTGINFKF
jgi:iron complex outermembrane recepter protein